MEAISITGNSLDRTLLEAFLFLQIRDVVSTLIGISLGNTEASPFIRLLIRWGPVTGLVCSKLFAAGCLAVCILLKRWGFIRWINLNPGSSVPCAAPIASVRSNLQLLRRSPFR